MAISLVPQGIVAAPSASDSVKLEPETALEKEALFGDYPKLKEICTCESGLNQYVKGSTSTVLRGNQNQKDVGICQINESFHKEKSASLGYDIYTTYGNVAYAKYLYDKEGTSPWIWSQACWDKPAKKDIALGEKQKKKNSGPAES